MIIGVLAYTGLEVYSVAGDLIALDPRVCGAFEADEAVVAFKDEERPVDDGDEEHLLVCLGVAGGVKAAVLFGRDVAAV